jgi:hypothetical protein
MKEEEQKEKNMTETEKRAEERLLKRRQIDSNGCWRYTGASRPRPVKWCSRLSGSSSLEG